MGEELGEDPEWIFVDSPWDLLRDCHLLRLNDYIGDWTPCIFAHILGVLSAYIFPVVGSVGLVGNLFIAFIFLGRIRTPTRQMIYLACVALSDWLTLVAFGWSWVWPAKGLPYATQGRIYFFTFNVSSAVCRAHRYAYSFTSCLSSNLFLLAALDRCLSIYYPLRYTNVPQRRARYLVGMVVVVSAVMMLPFAVMTGLFETTPNNKFICWLEGDQIFLQLYHVFFANSSFIQTFAIIAVNLALLVRLRRSAVLREQLTSTPSGRREIAASTLLLILSTVVVISALPQTVAYMFAFGFQQSASSNSSHVAIRLAYNISDVGWHLLFMQYATNWVFYYTRMPTFRVATRRFLRLQVATKTGSSSETMRGTASWSYISTRLRSIKSSVSRVMPYKAKNTSAPHGSNDSNDDSTTECATDAATLHNNTTINSLPFRLEMATIPTLSARLDDPPSFVDMSVMAMDRKLADKDRTKQLLATNPTSPASNVTMATTDSMVGTVSVKATENNTGNGVKQVTRF